MFQITPFSSRYLEDLTSLNKTLVDKWYKFEGRKSIKTTWENLTSKERFAHGGPWNDLETIKIHINEYLKFGHIDLITDQETNKLIGEIEYHYTSNDVHIDWIMIDGGFQKQGHGSNLINHLKQIAKKRNMNSLVTEPERGVKQFYQSNGFVSKSPAFILYKSNGYCKKSNVTHRWYEFHQKISGKKYGEEIYEIEYLQYLVKSLVKYSSLFDEKYPIYALDFKGGIIVKRNHPSFSHISSIFVLVHELNSKLNEQEYFEKARHESVASEQLFLTVGDDIHLDWIIDSRIENLKLIFN